MSTTYASYAGKSPKTDGGQSPVFLTHVVGDQSAVMAFMRDPQSYRQNTLDLPGSEPSRNIADETVTCIDTHGAAVFLAGDRAYKIKRAVCFPFMDFSTLARREEACRAEIAINRPTAPDIYIDAVAITRDRRGHLALNGQGEAIEWAVAMHRFDTSQTFDQLAERGLLTARDLDGAVDAVVDFHHRAPLRRAVDWVSDFADMIDQNDQSFHEAHHLFDQAETAQLSTRTKAEWRKVRSLLSQRSERQAVRRGHGDLHLRNLVRMPAGTRLFDAVEFDERFATGDVLYDLASLLMDLDSHGERAAANQVLNRFLNLRNEPSDLEALAALPLFLSMRAALHAKESAMDATHLAPLVQDRLEAEARHAFDYALDVLEPRDVSLTVVGGLSGSGKSTIAQALAPRVGRTPGALVLRSDIVRKTLMGVPWNQKLGANAYTAQVTTQVFQTLGQLAEAALSAGQSVIVDAVCAQAGEREAFEVISRRVECHFAGVWLDAPMQVRFDRVTSRLNDPSDADGEVVRVQEGYDLGDIAWPRVDSDAGVEAVLRKVQPLVDRLN